MLCSLHAWHASISYHFAHLSVLCSLLTFFLVYKEFVPISFAQKFPILMSLFENFCFVKLLLTFPHAFLASS